MINIVNSSFVAILSFFIMWPCSKRPLTTRTFSSSPLYKNLTHLTSFVSLDIIATSSIFSGLVSYANVSANHIPDVYDS
jgi:hypothetical protein